MRSARARASSGGRGPNPAASPGSDDTPSQVASGMVRLTEPVSPGPAGTAKAPGPATTGSEAADPAGTGSEAADPASTGSEAAGPADAGQAGHAPEPPPGPGTAL